MTKLVWALILSALVLSSLGCGRVVVPDIPDVAQLNCPPAEQLATINLVAPLPEQPQPMKLVAELPCGHALCLDAENKHRLAENLDHWQQDDRAIRRIYCDQVPAPQKQSLNCSVK